MKKIFFALLAVCFILILSLTAFAQGEIAKLDVNYTFKENGNVVVTASVFDIQEKSGILMLFYNVHFDDSKLEVVSSNVNMPSKWAPFADNDISEVLFMYNKLSDNYIWWSTYAGFSNEGYGITEDNEFRIEIELKPLEDCETNIKFVCESAYSDEDWYMENPLKSESKSISIKVKSNNNIDESSSSSEGIQSSEITEESEVNDNSSSEDIIEDSSDSEDVNDSTTENSDILDSSVESSMENSLSESLNISSEAASENTEDVQTESEQNDLSENHSEVSIASETSDDGENTDDKNDNDNALIVIITAVVIAILSIGVFFIIKTKRGK